MFHIQGKLVQWLQTWLGARDMVLESVWAEDYVFLVRESAGIIGCPEERVQDHKSRFDFSDELTTAIEDGKVLRFAIPGRQYSGVGFGVALDGLETRLVFGQKRHARRSEDLLHRRAGQPVECDAVRDGSLEGREGGQMDASFGRSDKLFGYSEDD